MVASQVNKKVNFIVPQQLFKTADFNLGKFEYLRITYF